MKPIGASVRSQFTIGVHAVPSMSIQRTPGTGRVAGRPVCIVASASSEVVKTATRENAFHASDSA